MINEKTVIFKGFEKNVCMGMHDPARVYQRVFGKVRPDPENTA